MLTWPLHHRRKHLQFSRKNTLKTQKSFSTAGQLEGISVIPTTASSCWQLPTPEQQQGLADRPHCPPAPRIRHPLQPPKGPFPAPNPGAVCKSCSICTPGLWWGAEPTWQSLHPYGHPADPPPPPLGRKEQAGGAGNGAPSAPPATFPLVSMGLQRFTFLILGFG